jgi:2,3-bisphosphoglycerate-dependent phosphoglycerate mutase
VELVLVRHAQPQWYVEDRHQGNDPILTELGHRQAELVAERLAPEGFDEIYVSPLTRARQTAQPLLQRLGRDEVLADWLREIRDPEWTGTARDEVISYYEAEDDASLDERWRGLPGGERVDDFHKRIVTGLHEFLAGYGIVANDHEVPSWNATHGSAIERANGPKILCVAHAGTNGVIASHLLGASHTPFEWARVWSDHTSVIRFTARAASGVVYFALRSMDSVHLSGDLRTH